MHTSEKLERKRLRAAIAHYCLRCAGGTRKAVQMCKEQTCPLWRFRTGRAVHASKMQVHAPPRSPIEAIHEYCAMCGGGEWLPYDCPFESCELWLYRMGVLQIAGIEQKAAANSCNFAKSER